MSSQLSVGDIKKLKVPELKKELTARGCSDAGLKADLIARLEQAIQTQPTNTTTAAAPATAAAAAGAASPAGATAGTSTPSASPAAGATASPDASASKISLAGAKPAAPIKQTGDNALEEILAAKKRRAEKFGTEVQLSEAEKKKARGARFGVETVTHTQQQKGAQPAAKKQKQEQNNKPAAGNVELSAEEVEKLAKRAAKFGTAPPPQLLSLEEKKKAAERAARFASSSVDGSKKASLAAPKPTTEAPQPAA